MNEKDHYIDSVRNELYKAGLARMCWWGAFLVLLSGAIDLFELSRDVLPLLILCITSAVILASIGLLSSRSPNRDIQFHRVLGLLAIATAAGFLEIMNAQVNGLHPPRLIGQVILIVAAIGFAPASLPTYAAGAGVLFGISVIPSLVLDAAPDRGAAFLSSGVLISVLAVTVMHRLMSDRSLQRELSRGFDLRGSDWLYRHLFEQSSEPLFIVDAELRPVDANGRAVELLGYPKTVLRQRGIADLVAPDQISRFGDELQRLRSGGSPERFEGKMRTKEGRWLDIDVTPVAQDGEERLAGRLFVVRDITEGKELREALQRSRKELERNVLERTLSLSALNDALEREVGERRRAEERVIRQLDRQRALSTVERSIASSLDPDVTLNVFIDQVMGQLGADAAAVMLYDATNRELAFAVARGFRSNRIMKVRVKAGRSLAGTVISRRARIAIADLERPEASYPSAEGYQFNNSFMVKDEGFRSYIGVPLTVKGEVKGTLEVFHRSIFHPEDDWLEFLDALSQQASIAIDNAEMYAALQRSHDDISLAYDKTIEGWSRALDIRDNETHGHSQRVADLTVKIARAVGIDGSELVHVRRGALLHDIGKLGVPDSILLKPGKLTNEEMAIMKRHPEIAFDILAPIPFLREALDIPYLHHEKWDGSGYPRGIGGTEIPVAARIFAIIDVWDALRSDRPYRAAWDDAKVKEYLRSESGKHFDPDIVERFLSETPRFAA